MKIYSMNFKDWYGVWQCERFEATCDTDARFTARAIYRRENRRFACGFSLQDFYGNYIEL